MSRNISLAAALAVGMGTIGGVQAAEVNWIGGAAGDETNFSHGDNWDGGNVPTAYVIGLVNGDIAVFDGDFAGVDNKTPTLTADYDLLGLRFVDGGWTLDTGSNTLRLSWQGEPSIQSGSGTNTINGTLHLGGWDTNEYPVIDVAGGGTLRLNANVGSFADANPGNGQPGNGNAGIEKRGQGILELNTTGTLGVNAINVYEGTVKLVAETAGGVTGDGRGGLGNAFNRHVTIQGGVLDINGASGQSIQNLTLGAPGELTNSSETTRTVQTHPQQNRTLSGLISGNLNMTFGANASNTTTITNNNTYTGDTTIANSAGGGGTTTVVITADNAFGVATSAITLGSGGNSGTHARILTNGPVTLIRDITLAASTNASSVKTLGALADVGGFSLYAGTSTFSGQITVGTQAGGSKLTLLAGEGGRVDFTGNIVEHAHAALGVITKEGRGIVSLSGNNTYAGGTTVAEGTLLVNNTAGSGTGSGDVTVALGGILGGTGSIAGDVGFADGSTFLALLDGSLDLGGRVAIGENVTIKVNDTLTQSSYTVLTHGEGELSGTFAVDSSISDLGYQVVYGADSVSLVVPEPSMLAMAGLGGLALLRRRRRC